MTNPEFLTVDVFMRELLSLLTGDRRPMAKFEVLPAFITSPCEAGHLLVAAAHEAYLMGLAHGRGTPREETDASDVEQYTDMTYAVKAAVDEYMAQNPSGYAGF